MEFEGWWNLALAREQLPYFHMSNCETRNGLFRNMDIAARKRLQHVFIDLIASSKIAGIAVGVSQDAIAAAHDELARFRVRRDGQKQSMVTPYLFAFEVCVNTILAYVESLPASEQVEFVFDKIRQYEGRAHEVHRILLNCKPYRNRHRIGQLTFERKTTPRAVPIQAADILAYEVMRQLRDAGPERWQIQELARGLGRFAIRYYSPIEVESFVARLHAAVDVDPEVDASA